MKKLVAAIAALVTLVGGAAAQSTFDTCAAIGSAKRADVQELNRKKNRDGSPTDAQINTSISFGALLAAGEHPKNFKEGDGAEITAYVSDVKIGAVETCNCGKKDAWYRDSHIELTLEPMNASDKTNVIVVEVTPRFRDVMKKRGLDWSQRGLRDAFLGRWVRVRGWVFYDAMHDDESATSATTARVWRGSAWEIHPVTNITVVDRPTTAPSETPAPPSTQCTGTTSKNKRCQRTTTHESGRCYQHRSFDTD